MKADDPKIDMLKTIPRLRDRPTKELAELARLVDVCHFPEGTVLAVEGKFGAETLVVVQGEVEVVVADRVVARVGPGEFIGEMAQIDHGRRSATVRATSPVTALVIGPQAFPTVIDNPTVAKAMLQGVVSRMRRTQAASTGHPALDVPAEA
jgi:CRP-like cAMP-binding protein